ncbi:TPA: type II secretion system protein [Candidatus Scatousia excrementigallinarum]|uniref:Type II secretion system protein n=1 Tax=Candidatus Scatousia excrementigallinarum TaxID=2840935 RepID=A0A9D1EYG8_9BACT|nr:type II secretion system protein [Candidatus Scatousia excrementigallinarum]
MLGVNSADGGNRAAVTSGSTKRTGALYYTAHYPKFGFTLAEVLITLGIIGIVAAMTLPSLVQSHKEKQTVAQLKKFYSTISNAMLLAYNEHGPLEDWGIVDGGSSEEEYAEGNAFKNKFIYNLKPYLNILSFCEFGNSSCEKEPYSMKSLDGTIHTLAGVKFLPHLVLADGSTINHLWFSKASQYGEIYVDLNGAKAPNTLGIDIFVFGIFENKLIPYGLTHIDKFKQFRFENLCSLKVKNRMNGYGCAAWVIFEENMQYLKCNDLSFNGKKKCK